MFHTSFCIYPSSKETSAFIVSVIITPNKYLKKLLFLIPNFNTNLLRSLTPKNGDLTFHVIRWLIKHNVQISILNWDGKLLTTMLPP